jgi:hypothetical protein
LVVIVTRYDLSELDWLPLNRTRRWGRVAMVAMAAAMLVLIVFIATSGFHTITGNWSAGKAAFLLVPGLVIILGGIGFATSAPGALAVEVTDEGVVFEFRNGRRWEQRWGAKDFRLSIERAPALGPKSSVPVPVWVAYGPGRGFSFITEGAYNDIRQRATSLGLNVTRVYARFRGERMLITASRPS